MTRGYQYCTLC